MFHLLFYLYNLETKNTFFRIICALTMPLNLMQNSPFETYLLFSEKFIKLKSKVRRCIIAFRVSKTDILNYGWISRIFEDIHLNRYIGIWVYSLAQYSQVDPILEKCVHLQVQYSRVLSQYS